MVLITTVIALNMNSWISYAIPGNINNYNEMGQISMNGHEVGNVLVTVVFLAHSYIQDPACLPCIPSIIPQTVLAVGGSNGVVLRAWSAWSLRWRLPEIRSAAIYMT